MGTLLHPTDDYNWTGEAEGGRMTIWGRGIRYMIDRPFTGVGICGRFPLPRGRFSCH